MVDDVPANSESSRKQTTSDEVEWEDRYFVAEVTGVFDEKDIVERASKNDCKLLGADTAEPVLQIGSNIFTGQWRGAVGTDLVLKVTESSGAGRRKPRSVNDLTVLGVSDRRLVLEKGFLIRRSQQTDQEHGANSQTMPSTPDVEMLKQESAGTS